MATDALLTLLVLSLLMLLASITLIWRAYRSILLPMIFKVRMKDDANDAIRNQTTNAACIIHSAYNALLTLLIQMRHTTAIAGIAGRNTMTRNMVNYKRANHSNYSITNTKKTKKEEEETGGY
eukprot:2803541-Pyramimonas_sp.AAC.1